MLFGTSEPKLHALEPALHELATSITASISPARLKQDVVNLNYSRNRLHSPDAMIKAEEYILSALRDAGWQTERYPFSLKQVKGNLDYGSYGPTVYPELSGVNLIATRPGQGSNGTLIIEAHYDTVQDSPGADDNTSGVAALLELARVLKPLSFKQNVMLICCDMEELGFIGANQLVKKLKAKYKIAGAIVLETIACTSDKRGSQKIPPNFGLVYPGQASRIKKHGFTGDFTAVIYHNIARSLALSFSESLAHFTGNDSVMLLRAPGDVPVLGRILRKYFYSLIVQFYRADHYPFLVSGIPAIQVTDTADFRNPRYHQPTDTPDTLDYKSLAKMVAATAMTILR